MASATRVVVDCGTYHRTLRELEDLFVWLAETFPLRDGSGDTTTKETGAGGCLSTLIVASNYMVLLPSPEAGVVLLSASGLVPRVVRLPSLRGSHHPTVEDKSEHRRPPSSGEGERGPTRHEVYAGGQTTPAHPAPVMVAFLGSLPRHEAVRITTGRIL